MICTYFGKNVGKTMISLSLYVFYPFGKMLIREREGSSSLVRNDFSFSDYEMMNMKSEEQNQQKQTFSSQKSVGIIPKFLFYFLYTLILGKKKKK